MKTEEFTFDTAKGHSGLEWAFYAAGGSDWYEAVTALYAVSDTDFVDPLAAKCYRGQSFGSFEVDSLAWSTNGNFRLAFYVASYDRTGGSAMGASISVASFGFVTTRRLRA